MHILDVLTVGIIVFIAITFLIIQYYKNRKNKCATLCSSCGSGGGCSSKNFSRSGSIQQIRLIKRANSI